MTSFVTVDIDCDFPGCKRPFSVQGNTGLKDAQEKATEGGWLVGINRIFDLCPEHRDSPVIEGAWGRTEPLARYPRYLEWCEQTGNTPRLVQPETSQELAE